MNKLLITLIKVYPGLMKYIENMCNDLHLLSFAEFHAGLKVLSLLPKVFEKVDNPGITLEFIIEKVRQVQVKGFEKKVICRDLLIVIRKWLSLANNLALPYETLLLIRNSEINDLVITYECLLVLKELLNYPVSSELSTSIICNFGQEIFGILKEVRDKRDYWEVLKNTQSTLKVN